MNDPVNHPPHYTSHPSGIECIEVTRHMGFNIGNAIKYLWRCDLKRGAIEDLKKAVWYIEDEIKKREKENANKTVHVHTFGDSVTTSVAYNEPLDSTPIRRSDPSD